MLSCPNARRAGLDDVLAVWLAHGELEPGALAFAPLDALAPRLPRHAVRARPRRRAATPRAMRSAATTACSRAGFELALRSSHWAALDWWLTRAPELANRVPPTQGNQLPWVPLARVLVPTFLTHPEKQKQTLEFLMAHGASPWRKLPFDSGSSVVQYARTLNSPLVAVLDPPPVQPVAPTVLATTSSPAGQFASRR